MTIILGQFVCLGFCSSSFFMLPGASPMLLENMPNGVNLWLLASFIFYFLEFEKSCCHQLLVVLDPECNPVDPNPLQSITLFPGSFAGSVFARNIHRAAAPHNTTLFTNFRAAVRSLRSPASTTQLQPGHAILAILYSKINNSNKNNNNINNSRKDNNYKTYADRICNPIAVPIHVMHINFVIPFNHQQHSWNIAWTPGTCTCYIQVCFYSSTMMFVESLCSNKIFSIPQKNLDSYLEHLSSSIGNSICRKLDYKQRPSCAVHAVCGLVLRRGDYTYRCKGKS